MYLFITDKYSAEHFTCDKLENIISFRNAVKIFLDK